MVVKFLVVILFCSLSAVSYADGCLTYRDADYQVVEKYTDWSNVGLKVTVNNRCDAMKGAVKLKLINDDGYVVNDTYISFELKKYDRRELSNTLAIKRETLKTIKSVEIEPVYEKEMR